MKKGTVKFFNESKGFGFIIEEESKQEYFVHVSGLIDEIREDDNVEFELKEGRKGLKRLTLRFYNIFDLKKYKGPELSGPFFVPLIFIGCSFRVRY